MRAARNGLINKGASVWRNEKENLFKTDEHIVLMLYKVFTQLSICHTTVFSSERSIKQQNDFTCPTKILPAAERDSAAEVPMVTCMSQAIFDMISGITPK